MNKKSYVLSVIAVIAATLLVVIAPDIASVISSEQMGKAVIYKSSELPSTVPVTAEEVISAYAEGDFIYSYNHQNFSYDELREAAIKVTKELFSGSRELQEAITRMMSTSDIYLAEKTSGLIMAEDKVAAVELVRIDFEWGLAMFFEETTGVVLDFYCALDNVDYEEAQLISESAVNSGEEYYKPLIGERAIDYIVVSDSFESGVYINIYVLPVWDDGVEKDEGVLN